MPKTFDKFNDPETQALLTEVATAHAKELVASGVRVDTIFVRSVTKDGEVQAGLMHHGYPAAAVAKINPLKDRAMGKGDALITIDEVVWDTLSDAQKAALLHHELHHLQIALERVKIGNEERTQPATDDVGRPKLAMRKHDWELGGFAIVAEKHGADALEVEGAVKLARDYGGVLEATRIGLASKMEEAAGTDAVRGPGVHNLTFTERMVENAKGPMGDELRELCNKHGGTTTLSSGRSSVTFTPTT